LQMAGERTQWPVIDPCDGRAYQSYDAQELHKTLTAALSRI